MRIGIISDTHIADPTRALPDAVQMAFADVQCILHAGDICCQSVLDNLATLAPVHAVHGNVDPPELMSRLPDSLVLDLAGMRIGLTHGHLGSGDDTPERALNCFRDESGLMVVVFGHSHQPYNQVRDGVLLFNPGSPTQRRRQPYPSYGLLAIEDGLVRGTIIFLDRPEGN